MGNLISLKRKIQALEVGSLLDQVVDEKETEILKIYQEKQLFEGKNEDNEPIGLYRSIGYQLKKNKMNPKPGMGVVDLKYTGSMYKGMAIVNWGTMFVITSSVSYFNDLVKKYSAKWLGWNMVVKKEIKNRYTLPGVQTKLRQHLGI